MMVLHDDESLIFAAICDLFLHERQIRKISTVPLTILGGAGSLQDIKDLIDEFRIIGASAGSIFVFIGRYRAVLINYTKPNMI